MTTKRTPKAEKPEGIRYSVLRFSEAEGASTVVVTAESGDEAAAKAFADAPEGTSIRGVTPEADA